MPFNYNKYATYEHDGDTGLKTDLQLFDIYGTDYKQLIKDILENKTELSAIEELFDGDLAHLSGGEIGGDWTKCPPEERTKVVTAYLIGLKTGSRISDWAQQYSTIGFIPLNKILVIDKLEDMEDCFDNDNYKNLPKEEKEALLNDVKKLKEDRREIVVANKAIYSSIVKGEYNPYHGVVKVPKEPAAKEGRKIPENSAIDFDKLLDEQRLFNEMNKDAIDFEAIPYMSKLDDDYTKYIGMGDGQYMRTRFDEAFNRLAKGEKIFATQPEFSIGREGREQIIKYLNDLECVRTDAFIEKYGDEKDKELYNKANDEKGETNKTPAQVAEYGYFSGGSHTPEQIEDLIYNSLSYKEKYMDALGMKKLTDPASKSPEEYKSNAIDLIKQAKAEYNGCSWLSQVFGYIFPTKAGKINDQIKFMRSDLISKGIPAAEITELENAPEVQNQPAENINNDNKEVNKKPANLKKEDAQVGLGENNKLDKSKPVQPEKNNQLNVEQEIVKDK